MAEGSYIPLTNEALEDFKEYLKIPWLMQNIVPDPPGTKFRSIRSKRYRTAARLFCYVRPYRPESDYRNSILSQKRIYFRRRK